MGELSAEIVIDAAMGTLPDQQIHRLNPQLTTQDNVDSPELWANQL